MNGGGTAPQSAEAHNDGSDVGKRPARGGSLDAGMQDGGGAGPATRAAGGDGKASRPRKTHAKSGARRLSRP